MRLRLGAWHSMRRRESHRDPTRAEPRFHISMRTGSWFIAGREWELPGSALTLMGLRGTERGERPGAEGGALSLGLPGHPATGAV